MAKGKVCLAYSGGIQSGNPREVNRSFYYIGGLDTSCILRWLLDEGYEVVCCLANVGQEEDWDAVEKKALKIGAQKMVIEDLQKEFVEELCFRAVQCNAQYEGRYLLGTSLARPVITRCLMRTAQHEGCDYVSHGATFKGNDGIRFELAAYALKPSIKIIAPWRESSFFNKFQGRNDLLDYAAEKGIPVTSTKAKPWSMDENLAHCSYEAGYLEQPDQTPPDDMWTMTNDPLTASNEPTDITIGFQQGIPIKLVTPQKTFTESVQLFKELNRIGKIHGTIDIVENRFIGLKSRGCYDSPAMTILRLAHLDIEGLTLDSQVRALRDQFVTHNWSTCLYNGYYFAPERLFLENSLVFSQKTVNGEVRLRCCKGAAYVLGRSSTTSKLYSQEEASMDSLENFDPQDTTGFIKIQAIRLKKYSEEWAV